MQQKHSPLPWTANAYLVCSNKGYLVAEALSQQTEVDCLDAQFIVRACNNFEELLEICIKVEEMIYDSDSKIARDAAEILQAAITKAKGE